jgi:hypothetical protein
MATQNLDSADLKAVQRGGLIREDVMDRIWDISQIPLPFTDRIGTGSHDNEYFEWTQDRLADPNLNNAQVDGSNQNTNNDTRTGARLGNHSQISTKTVQVSSRADASDTIGRARELAYQVMMRQRELRRDREAIALTGQGSVADDGATIAGKTAGVFAFCNTNFNGGTGAAVPGFQNGSGLITGITQGTKRAGTETMVRDMAQKIFELGGDPGWLMGRPGAIRKFSEYCFTTQARIATMTTDVGQGEDASTAKGAVNVFVTDFGVTLDLIPNRLQPEPAAGVSNMLMGDPSVLAYSILRGFQTEPLAKQGLSELRMMSVDWGLMVGNDDAIGALLDIDYTVPWAA